MYTIIVEDECECFKKSNLENNTTELLRSQALMKANQMCNIMNNTFKSGKKYMVVEEKRTFIIKEGEKKRPAHCCGDGCCLN